MFLGSKKCPHRVPITEGKCEGECRLCQDILWCWCYFFQAPKIGGYGEGFMVCCGWASSLEDGKDVRGKVDDDAEGNGDDYAHETDPKFYDPLCHVDTSGQFAGDFDQFLSEVNIFDHHAQVTGCSFEDDAILVGESLGGGISLFVEQLDGSRDFIAGWAFNGNTEHASGFETGDKLHLFGKTRFFIVCGDADIATGGDDLADIGTGFRDDDGAFFEAGAALEPNAVAHGVMNENTAPFGLERGGENFHKKFKEFAILRWMPGLVDALLPGDQLFKALSKLLFFAHIPLFDSVIDDAINTEE